MKGRRNLFTLWHYVQEHRVIQLWSYFKFSSLYRFPILYFAVSTILDQENPTPCSFALWKKNTFPLLYLKSSKFNSVYITIEYEGIVRTLNATVCSFSVSVRFSLAYKHHSRLSCLTDSADTCQTVCHTGSVWHSAATIPTTLIKQQIQG